MSRRCCSVLCCFFAALASIAAMQAMAQAMVKPVSTDTTRPYLISAADNADPRSVERLWRLMKTVYNAEGIEVQLVKAPLARIHYMANSGQVDAAIGGLPESTDGVYPNLVKVPTPIFRTAYHVYAMPELRFTGLESLQGKRIIAMRGSESLKRILPNEDIRWLNDSVQLIRLLEGRRADFAIALENTANNLLAEMPDTLVSRKDEEAFYSFRLHHYVNERHRELVPRLDQRLQQVLAKLRKAKSAP